MLHIINNPGGYFFQNIPRNTCPVGSHTVHGSDCTNAYRVIISPCVSHDSNTSNVWQYREVLPNISIQSGSSNFFAQNSIGFSHYFQLFFCYLTQYANGKTRAGEWLTPNNMIRNTELCSQFAYFIFKQCIQRLD